MLETRQNLLPKTHRTLQTLTLTTSLNQIQMARSLVWRELLLENISELAKAPVADSNITLMTTVWHLRFLKQLG
ncbi:hypothetical protein AAY84_19310 [Serratia marcescens]|nr:hypothetical protein AAY84_19310 [Serratia marcescens]